MAFNLAKKYPELLEIMHYNEFERKKSLRAIFDRDITDNDSFKFNDKQIRPTKKRRRNRFGKRIASYNDRRGRNNGRK